MFEVTAFQNFTNQSYVVNMTKSSNFTPDKKYNASFSYSISNVYFDGTFDINFEVKRLVANDLKKVNNQSLSISITSAYDLSPVNFTWKPVYRNYNKIKIKIMFSDPINVSHDYATLN